MEKGGALTTLQTASPPMLSIGGSGVDHRCSAIKI